MKRTKITLSLRELNKVDVGAISLVDHPANRTPFKLMKRKDEPMKNIQDFLAGLKKSDKKKEPVWSLILTNTAIAGEVQKAAEGLGHPVLETQDLDNGITVMSLVKGALASDEPIEIVQLNNDVAIGVKVEKSFYSWMPDGTEFTEAMKAANFYPSLRVANEVLQDTVYAIMNKADKGPPLKELKKAFQEHASYALSLASSLPVNAFKLEKMEFTASEGIKGLGDVLEKTDSGSIAGTKNQSNASSIEAALTKSLNPVLEGLTGISDTVKALESRVIKTETALRNTALGGTGSEDLQVTTEEGDLFDSALDFSK